MRILSEAMGSFTNEEIETNNNKIIKNILKNTTIDKSLTLLDS